MANGVIIPNVDNTWTQVSVTVDNQIIQQASQAYVYKRNGVCQVYLGNVTFKNAGDSQTNAITGLPKAVTQSGGLASGANSAITAIVMSDAMWINVGGTALNFHIGSGHHTYGHWFYMTYPCED